ncbi:hypothetical protein B0H21DRAFT_893800 [Amylocystis lapponica]|nr:hypothetical protein B0H21DRAFT_893800 [Amylocystis lapponica]
MSTSDDDMDSTEEDTASDVRALYVRSLPNVTVPTTPPRHESPPEMWKKTQSTPYKARSLSLVTNDKNQVKNEDVLSFLRVEFRDKIYREYPVKDFVKHVWNFEANDHPNLRLKIGSFAPHAPTVESYNEAPNEVSRYPYLSTISNDLLTHLFPDPTKRAIQINVVIVENHTVAGRYAFFKPDLTWSTTPGPEDQQWDWVLLCAEVKRGKAEKFPDPKRLLQGNVPFPEPIDESFKNRKRPASKHDSVEPSPKRIKEETVSPHEAQTAKYLNEMLSHGIRSFASGLFIKDREMQLWYGDRMGLVKSCAFDWQEKPALMALVFAAFGTANLTQLGISPYLEFSPASPKFDSYKDGHIVLPAGEVVIRDSQEQPSEDMVFKIDTTRRVWTDWGAVGRGTTVVPLEAIDVAKKRFGTDPLVAKMAWPHANRTPEETFVRLVRGELQQKAPSYLRHIVDVKCFMARNMAEMGLPRAFMDIGLESGDTHDFRLIVMRRYERLESVESVDEFKIVFEHIVRAHHWVWTTSGILHRDISISNIMFYRDAEEHVVGVLCDWDMAEEKLSDEEYQASNARIFSVHTVPKEDPPATTSPKGKALSTIEEQDHTPQTIKGLGQAIPEGRPPRPRYRTGTGPFIALDILLEDEPPLYRYRHELESLFFLLSYVCAVFDPAKHHFGPFNAWERGSLDDIAKAKSFFYTSRKSFKSSFDHSHEDFRLLVDDWVTPLWELFSGAAVNRIQIDSLLGRRDTQASKGMDGMVATLDVEIGLLVTAWQKTITYDAFMDCLGLPPHLPTEPSCPSCDVAVSWCMHQA